ncbi:DUF4065 domain-containing protein [Asticcacaulis sp. SL142]|uniref:Panacea domain-containing protein n=1 Tax=Asticcacaulis sp. SL142 TaxID=2995155 RepID=UPI00226D310D|nr:type II toxin-antitoxin system antitoxin SocA domain-containing protein [Asticcacaulis sp. SL142]WAC47649.1 DUF4065 domain-containing protein [Asticcacaulis sp. SL142]
MDIGTNWKLVAALAAFAIRKEVVMYTPLIVANTFIDRYGQEGGLTHMKLQKLVFFADGWSKAFDQTLVNELPQVWRYGPVYRSLYDRLNVYGGQPIQKPVKPSPFSNNEGIIQRQQDADLVDWIWNRYGQYSGGDLSTMTHNRGTPWQVMAERYSYRVPTHLEIDNEIFKSYFKSLASSEGLIGAAST